MRVAILAGLAVLALAGCGAGDAAASCAPSVVWRGTTYLPSGATGWMPAPGHRLRGGVIPACHDTVVSVGGHAVSTDEPDLPVRLRRVAGVDPRLAFFVLGRHGGLYLAPGFLPQLAGHPLHELFPPPRPHGCGRSGRVAGIVEPSVDPAALSVRTRRGRSVAVLVQPDTRVDRRLRRAGHAFIRPGRRIAVTGERCADAIVARTIARA